MSEVTYRTIHESCDECVGLLARACEMMQFVASDTINVSSAEGGHVAEVRRQQSMN